MTTLYRSPSVIIDNHEWHLHVRKKDGRVSLQYYFRPLSAVRYRWLPVTSWKGRKPALFNAFQTYRQHALRARENDLRRRYEIEKRERRPMTGFLAGLTPEQKKQAVEYRGADV